MDGPADILHLPDGRMLRYRQYGVADGHPLFYFHGTPGAGNELELFAADSAERHGLRIVAADRPGMGRSTFQAGRQISDWPADLAALANHLDISRFGVLGYSGGAPYAVATAIALPERVTLLGLVAGVGPHDLAGVREALDPQAARFLELNRSNPRLARLITRQIGLLARFAPALLWLQMRRSLPSSDRNFLADKARFALLRSEIRESLRQGPRGAQLDSALMVGPWDVRFEDVRVPTRIWHGEQDREAPPLVARRASAVIAGAQATIFPQEGHLSVWANHADEILDSFARFD